MRVLNSRMFSAANVGLYSIRHQVIFVSALECKMTSWGENRIILVIYFTYPVNPFIARSGIVSFVRFRETARIFPIMHNYKIENGYFHQMFLTDYFIPNKIYQN